MSGLEVWSTNSIKVISNILFRKGNVDGRSLPRISNKLTTPKQAHKKGASMHLKFSREHAKRKSREVGMFGNF